MDYCSMVFSNAFVYGSNSVCNLLLGGETLVGGPQFRQAKRALADLTEASRTGFRARVLADPPVQ
jgi:hypothetical protein